MLLIITLGYYNRPKSLIIIVAYIDCILSCLIIYLARNINIIGITGTIGSGKTTLIK
jgi:hypothetical protein